MQGTIQERISRVVIRLPERACIIHGDRIYSYRETNERVNALANAFLDMGIGKGDKVAAGLYNGEQIVETWLAAFKIGAVAVNVNTHLTADEISHVLKASETRVLVLDEDLAERVKLAWPDLPELKRCIAVGKHVPESMLEYEAILDEYEKSEPRFDWQVHPDDMIQLFYTGGTTGTPKGVMHTHKSNLSVTDFLAVDGMFMGAFRAISTSEGYKEVIDSWLKMFARLMPHVPPSATRILSALAKTGFARWILRRRMVQRALRSSILFLWTRPPLVSRALPLKFLIASPITHATAWFGTLLSLVNGFTLVLTPSKHLVPSEVLELIETHHANVLFLVGDKMSRMILAADIDSFDCSSLAIIASSGAHWTSEVKAELHRHFPNCLLVDHLGSTESPIVSTGVYFKGDEYRKLGPGDREVRVVDAQGREVQPGEEGAILVRAESSGLGYYGDEESSQKTWIEDGWIFTGDSGTRDEKGNIIVFGRGSEVINSGGMKIWAPEVEQVISHFPKVQDVVVFGVPDPEWGESVMAAVRLKEGSTSSQEEIIEFVKERIAGFKKPKYVAFVEDLPILPSGKIKRGAVKEMLRDHQARQSV